MYTHRDQKSSCQSGHFFFKRLSFCNIKLKLRKQENFSELLVKNLTIEKLLTYMHDTSSNN